MPKTTPNDALTSERAHHLLRYEPDTGLLYWRGVRSRVSTTKPAGCIVKGAYRRIRIDDVDYMAHRVVWLMTHGVWPTCDIDHINGDRGDNRIANLRDVPRSINAQNQRIGRRGGLLGTAFHKANGRWRAIICVNYETTTLGYFDTQEEAHARYLKAKRELHIGNTL